MQPESRMDMARWVFGRFRVAFPALRFEEVPSEHVDLNVNVPQQDGLAFDVNLNLQGDELHLSVGDGFWLEWFPCGDPAVEASYVEAVAGLLSGEFRIFELRQNGVPVWARLERQVAGYKSAARPFQGAGARRRRGPAGVDVVEEEDTGRHAAAPRGPERPFHVLPPLSGRQARLGGVLVVTPKEEGAEGPSGAAGKPCPDEGGEVASSPEIFHGAYGDTVEIK